MNDLIGTNAALIYQCSYSRTSGTSLTPIMFSLPCCHHLFPQRLQAEITSGHQLLHALLCDAVKSMEKETGQKRYMWVIQEDFRRLINSSSRQLRQFPPVRPDFLWFLSSEVNTSTEAQFSSRLSWPVSLIHRNSRCLDTLGFIL